MPFQHINPTEAHTNAHFSYYSQNPEHTNGPFLPQPASPRTCTHTLCPYSQEQEYDLNSGLGPQTEPRCSCSPEELLLLFRFPTPTRTQTCSLTFTDDGQTAAVTPLLCSSSSHQEWGSQFELKRLLDAQGRGGGLRWPWSGELRLIGALRTQKNLWRLKTPKKQNQPNKQQSEGYHL